MWLRGARVAEPSLFRPVTSSIHRPSVAAIPGGHMSGPTPPPGRGVAPTGPTWQTTSALARPDPCRTLADAPQFRQAVFRRFTGYTGVSDTDRLARDAATRWIVGGRAVLDEAASTSQRGRFEICAMTSTANLTVLADLSGRWIDRVQGGRERRLCWTATAVDLRPRVRWQENRCTRIENNPQIGTRRKRGSVPRGAGQ